jgi:protein-disulfide isomerase
MSGRRDREARREERLGEEDRAQAAERRQSLIKLASAAGFLALIAVAVLVVVSSSKNSGGDASNIAGAGPVNQLLDGIPQEGMVLGKPGAKVTLLEFGDLQCPVCKEFSFQVAPDIISQIVRKGDANYEFRPWDIIGPQSPIASRAAYAAGEQGRGWSFIELFYRNQGEENSGYVTDSFLTSIAKGAGVKDLDKWNSDRSDDSKWDPLLSKNDSDAKSLGFTGTPSILVEGPGGKKPFTTIPTVSQIEAAVKSVS